MGMTTTPMSNDEIVENLKTMGFGKQAFERFNAKERETLNRAWNIIEHYETRLKADMVAMLTELKTKIEEKSFYYTRIFGKPLDEKRVDLVELDDVNNIIQQKINSLKETKDGEDR